MNSRLSFDHRSTQPAPPSVATRSLATCLGIAVLWSAAFAAPSFAQAPAAGAKPNLKEKLKEKSSDQALTMFADAANFQNNGAFELAAAEWEKFLQKFPDDPLLPKAQHYAGVCHLQLKNLEKAAAAFQATAEKFDKFELTEDAYLNLGWCRFSLAGQGKPELYEPASKAFAALLKEYPKGKYVDQGLFFQGESLVALDRRKDAVANYKRVVDEFPKSSLRCDAIYALGVTQEELGSYADAGKTYDLFLKDCAESELATEVRMRKAETMLQAGQHDEAAKMFGEAAAVDGFASADHALFRRAFCLAKLDKFAEAGKLYGQIAADFPKSVYAADAVLSAGRSYYRADAGKEAADFFAKVVAKGGKDAGEAAHWWSRILLKQKQPEQVVELITKVAPKAESSPFLVQLEMDKADALYEIADRREEALAAYVAVASDHPDNDLAPQALYNAAFTALELKQFDAARQHAAKFQESYAKDKLLADVQYVHAEALLQGGQPDKAEAAFAELVANQGDHSDHQLWQVRLGLSYYLQKKYADVINALAKTAPQFKAPDTKAEALFLTGASQFYGDQFEAAAKSLAAAIQASPKWRQADETLLYLSRAQRKQDMLDDAKATAKRLIDDFASSALLDQAHFRLGEYSYAAGDFPAAAEQYAIVTTKYPQSVYAPYALYGTGWSRLKQQDYAEGEKSFSALLADHPKHTLAGDTRFARAMCLRQTGKLAEAITDLDAYLKTNPDLAGKSDALYERGLAQVALKQYSDAATTFTALLDENKQYASADKVLYELAWANKLQDSPDKATAAFNRLTTEYPDSPLAAEAYFHVAEGQYKTKDYPAAAKSYAKTVGMSKNPALREKGIYKLGWSHFQQKQYEEALNQFDVQLKDFPRGLLSADGLFMKGESLFRLEKYDLALPVLVKASEARLSSPRIKTLVLLHGGQAAAQLKKWDESLKMLEAIPEQFPESPYLPQSLYDIGWAKQNQGKADDARKSYEQAATKSRGEVGARARFMLGELDFADKKFDEAIRQFQRVMFGFGGDQAAETVKRWQAKAGFDAARCAEVRIKSAADAKDKAKHIADAKKFYTYVVEKHGESDVAPQARKRLMDLAKL